MRVAVLLLALALPLTAETGYNAWLRYARSTIPLPFPP
jgi:hypothetical protein